MSCYTGGCRCGKLRYELSAEPISQGVCYCQDCQGLDGTTSSPLLVVASTAFSCTTDSLHLIETKSDRGSTVKRYFCRDCKSPVFSKIEGVDAIVTVKVATLDNTSFFRPEYLVFTQSAAPNTVYPPGVPRFAKAAPLEMVLKS